jgi:hypothetical protein
MNRGIQSVGPNDRRHAVSPQADQARLALRRVRLDGRAEFQAIVDFYQALADEQRVDWFAKGMVRFRQIRCCCSRTEQSAVERPEVCNWQ